MNFVNGGRIPIPSKPIRNITDELEIRPTGYFAMRKLLFCSAILITVSRGAAAQQFTVQQPALHNFSVGTTVSVPDRGRALIGGISRAGSSRTTYGPLRSGTNTGVFAQHSGASAHVTVHDFAELDRRALGIATSSKRDDTAQLSGNASHAYRVLQSRSRKP